MKSLVDEYEELTKGALKDETPKTLEEEDTTVTEFLDRVLGPRSSRWLRRMESCYDEDGELTE
jgi:hypothetical protein